MNHNRALSLKSFCHDEVVRIKANIDNGKLIPKLDTIVDIYKKLEEIFKHIEEKETG